MFLAFSCGGGGGGSSSSGNNNGGGTVVTSTQRAVSSGDVDLLVSVASSGKKGKFKAKKGRKHKETLDDTSFEDKKCLIFIAKLSDPSYTNLVGIIKTDDKGTYEIKTEDVFDYLKDHIDEVGETSDFAILDATKDENRKRILDAFKKLGVLRLRAFYNDDGKVVSMEFFQNVSESDPNKLENADPRNRIIAHWVEKIFKDLEIIPTEEQYEALETEIKAITDAILDEFELPEGVTLEQFANAFKSENSVILTDEQKTLILSILASMDKTLTDEQKEELKAAAGVPVETVADAISNGVDTTITGLINSLGEQIQKTIENAIENPADYPAFAKLLLENGGFLDITSDTFKEDFNFDSKAKESLIRFFIALGFPVVVNEVEGSEPLLAIALPMPGNVSEENLPGSKFFGDRNIRVFKVSDISTMVSTANSLFTSQDEVDTLAIKPIDTLSEADYLRLERLRVLHKFLHHLKRCPPMVSSQLVDALLAFKGSTKIKEVAAVMVDYFVWRQESISLVDDGKGNTIPVFTGGLIPPSTGEDLSVSEIVRKLSVQLGADPITAVDALTSSDSFLFQFVGKAIEEAVNRSNAEGKTFEFPKTLADARTLIRDSNAFRRAKDSVGRGLIAAFPPITDTETLYGKLLDGETSLSSKSAIFFVTYLFNSKFQIDETLDYLDEKTLRPRLDNDKFLASKDDDNFSLVKFVCSLLSLSEFSNSSTFTIAENLVKDLGSDDGMDASLYYLPEFRENFIPDNLSKKASITAKATIEFFDKRSVADISSLVSASAMPVILGPNGPEIGDGAAIAGVISAVTGSTTQWDITFSNVPSGSQYLVAIDVVGYTHDVPYLFFFADGFADPLKITRDNVFIIPPDEEFFVVPTLGMMANQKTFDSGELMGVDFSNFEDSLPFLLPISKDGQEGYVDLRFALLGSGKYSLETSFTGLNDGATDPKALIAPLYINWSGAEPVLGLKPATDFERLSNPQKAMGLNFMTLILSLVDGDMTDEAVLCDKDSTSVKDLTKDGPPLFLLKDRKGIFWILGVKHIDNAVNPGFVDLAFIRIGADGKIQVPEIKFQDIELGGQNPFIFVNLHYGDHAYFPSNTSGGYDIGRWEWSAPEEVPFGFNAASAALAQIRYAGEDFENRVGTGSAAEISALRDYIIAGDFTDVPSRLDYYGPVGGGLAVVQFDTSAFTWPTTSGLTYSSSVSGLVSGDIVLIRFKDSGDADLIAMVDKKTGSPARDNFKIGLVVANYNDDMVQVAGALVDADKDGYIAKFDPNDNDANIKPVLTEPKPASTDGSSMAGPSQVTGIFASENGSKFIFVEMHENINEVYQISVKISVKHSDGTTEDFPVAGETNLFEVTPADFTAAAGAINPTGIVKSGTAVTLKDVSFGNIHFDLVTSPSMFDVGGIFEPDTTVKFDYEFTFRPRDPATGLPISDVTLFGDNVSRPALKGSSTLIIPALANQVGDFDKSSVLIQQGTDTPQQMADSLRLEPQKETLITWGAVTNANFYELSISFENVSSGGIFLPNFRLDFFAPSDNRSVMIPSFMLPQGRTGGNIQIIARRYNALGQPTFDGTVVTYTNISTTGDATTGGMPGGGINDIKLKSGDKLYFHSDTRIIDTNSTGGQALFSITPGGTTAQIILESGISAEGFLAPPMVKKSKVMRKHLKDVFTAGSTFTVTPGTYMTFLGITLTDGSVQPIDVNFSGFRVDEVVIQAFLPPPFVDISTGGNFDVNNDTVMDVTYDGTSTLTFVVGIKVTRHDQNLGPVVISTDGVATVYSIPVATTHQDFELEFSDGKRYWFFIDMAMKTVQWGEIFGGTPPPPTGSIFNGTLFAGDDLDFDNVNFSFAITSVASVKNMLQYDGVNVTTPNGWKLSYMSGGSPVEVTTYAPPADILTMYRIANTSLNMMFDLEMTKFSTGELVFKLMPPNNTGGSTGGGTPPPDPFTTNTFVFDDTMLNGEFLEVTSAAPFTFTITGASGSNTALTFAGSILTPAAGWVMYNELNTVIGSITPTVGFANFIRMENTTLGVAFSGFVKLVNADARIGVMNVNSIGGGTGGGTFTGLYEGFLNTDEYLTVNDDGTNATFQIDLSSSNVMPLTTLLKFAVTNEVVPQNGWTIEIFNGVSFVPAGSLFATTTPVSTRFKHGTDLRTFNIDFKIELLKLGVRVMNLNRGTPPPPPPPGILLNNGEYFNRIPGSPTTFGSSVAIDSTNSMVLASGGMISGVNTWQLYDLSDVLITSIAPTVGGMEVFLKSSDNSVTEKYRVKVTLYTILSKVGFEVMQTIPILPPPPGVDVLDTNFLKYIPGSPAGFASSATTVISVTEETIFQFNASQIIQDNGWNAFDATGVTPVPLPFTATVAITTLVFKKSGAEIKLDVNLSAPNLHVVVVNVIPASPPPALFTGDLNLNDYLNGNITLTTPVFNVSPTFRDGTQAIPPNVISLIRFSSAATFMPVNGFTVTDLALTPVASYTVPDVNVPHQFIIKSADATKTYHLDVGMTAGGQMHVVVNP